MKKIGALLLVLALCGSLFACAAVQNAQTAFLQSPEGAMIGRTFADVEAAFGPFSTVYLEEDRPAAYVFSRSNVAFHFSAPLVQKSWANKLSSAAGFIPGAIALRDIQPTDLCVGVSGRIKDFGIADSDVQEMSNSLLAYRPETRETRTNTIYSLTTQDGAYEVNVYCARGETVVTPDHQIEVTALKQRPAADPSVTEFTFGGATIKVGETKVEIRASSRARRTIPAQEVSDLVRYCPDLQSLILDYCDIEGVEQIGLLTDLTHLEIMSCNLPDISFIAGLTKVTELGLCHNRISDLTPIEDLPLTYLNLADNPALGNRDLRSVGYITTLQTLYIYSLNLSDLSALQSLKKLVTLNVNNDSKINEDALEVVSYFPKLRKLQINNTGVTSFDFLFTDCPNLRELDARKLNKLKNPTESILKLPQRERLSKLSVGKDLQESLDAQTQADYGMSAVDWFKSQDVTLSFQ